eukprot:365083-Chlamydomonas_euryale.AAC.35
MASMNQSKYLWTATSMHRRRSQWSLVIRARDFSVSCSITSCRDVVASRFCRVFRIYTVLPICACVQGSMRACARHPG